MTDMKAQGGNYFHLWSEIEQSAHCSRLSTTDVSQKRTSIPTDAMVSLQTLAFDVQVALEEVM